MDYSFNWSIVAAGAPYVTISTLGIAFNFVSIEKLGTPEKIIIGFDEDKMAIGIKAFDEFTEIKSYDFASRVKNGWIRIGCKDFINYLSSKSGIDFSRAKKYVAKFNKTTSTLIVDVVGEMEDVSRNATPNE